MLTFTFLMLSMLGFNPWQYTVNAAGQIVPIGRTASHSNLLVKGAQR